MPQAEIESGQISGPGVASGEFVTRTGKYFEVGKTFTDMKGVRFGITEAEADTAVREFAPGPLNLQHLHTPHLLTGKLGTQTRLWREGNDLMAEFMVPKWLNEATDGQPIPVSSEWDVETKKPLPAALVLKGAVSDAVMMGALTSGVATPAALVEFAQSEHGAAFAMTRHNTPEGQTAIQELHDQAARAGAVCDRKNVQMASQHEATAIQKIHDMAASHGAACKSGDAPAWARANYSQQTQTQQTQTQQTAAKADDHTAQSAKGDRPMWETLKALFAKAGVPADDLDAVPAAAFAAPAPADNSAEVLALKAQIALIQADKTAAEAAAFADRAIGEGRAYPAERAALIAQFTQAAEDDRTAPRTVQFAAAKEGDKTEGTRTDALRAAVAARPAHGLTSEQVAQSALGGQVVGFAAAPEAAKAQAEYERVLSLTGVGQSILAGKTQKNGSK
jgi:hypothetical protein